MVGVAAVGTIVHLSVKDLLSSSWLDGLQSGFREVPIFFSFFNVDVSLVPSCTKIFIFCIYWK